MASTVSTAYTKRFRNLAYAAAAVLSLTAARTLMAQSAQPGVGAETGQQPPASAQTSRANLLRGEYGRYRANNDLLFYHLDVRVDPAKKHISGKNTIRFRMLQDDDRIQLDLAPALEIDK